MKVGDTIKTGQLPLGRSSASSTRQGSAYESEIWTDVTDLQQQTKRNIYSSVFVRLPDAGRRQPVTSRRSRATSA